MLYIIIGILIVNHLTTHVNIVVGHRHIARLISLFSHPEALPFVTGHDVEVMILVEILVILCIGTQCGITLYLLPVALLAVVHATRSSWRVGEEVCVLATL